MCLFELVYGLVGPRPHPCHIELLGATAVMVLHNSSSPAIIHNLLEEINQMKFLKHPHIVCYLGVEMNMNSFGYTLYIFQELMPTKESISSLLKRIDPFLTKPSSCTLSNS
jgi:hypothetical protein